jgi:hypothetical protein
MRATLLQNILDDSIEAVVEETYDQFEGSHMSWTPMILDAQGRMEIAEILERALTEAINVQESTKARLMDSQEAGTSYTVSILGYSSIGGRKKVGPPVDAEALAGAGKESKAKGGKRGRKTAGKTAKAQRAASAKKAPPKGKGGGRKK